MNAVAVGDTVTRTDYGSTQPTWTVEDTRQGEVKLRAKQGQPTTPHGDRTCWVRVGLVRKEAE